MDELSSRDVMLSSKVTLVYKVALPAIVVTVFAPELWHQLSSVVSISDLPSP